MNLKTLNYIRNKAQLQKLYISQFTPDYIRKEIYEVLKKTRENVTAGALLFAKNISTEEVIIFINRNGKPDGYILSDELKMQLREYKDDLIREKFLLNELQKTKI
ncbi:hypothetical protein OIU80_20765 [Flavobacterium sp. LS1R47]|uniref:Uncharacterized protein n=1 Tax=Flavobacterium frigoritolerans TaxID=2987686 RepID=A0A9X3HNN6_9FLAO|nr:hypothetical protein [Flavobacterium frigoritolerans]MCV9934715.1 hypothetical protein [Flavobacterium frigoritolerans]